MPAHPRELLERAANRRPAVAGLPGEPPAPGTPSGVRPVFAAAPSALNPARIAAQREAAASTFKCEQPLWSDDPSVAHTLGKRVGFAKALPRTRDLLRANGIVADSSVLDANIRLDYVDLVQLHPNRLADAVAPHYDLSLDGARCRKKKTTTKAGIIHEANFVDGFAACNDTKYEQMQRWSTPLYAKTAISSV
ncbi:hypothetical protein HDU86_002727 [Geranomyces michiganensis]|nr:hypothetical protein HDU86_002727 [Geranomyces michiganensis]